MPGTAKFDLTLFVHPHVSGLQCSLEYSTDLFSQERVRRWLEQWQRLLEAVVADPGTRINDLPLLSMEEQNTFLSHWNQTSAPLPQQSLPALLSRQAEQTPDRIALVCNNEMLTYAELERRANQIALMLRRKGVRPEALVGIYQSRSLLMLQLAH